MCKEAGVAEGCSMQGYAGRVIKMNLEARWEADCSQRDRDRERQGEYKMREHSKNRK